MSLLDIFELGDVLLSWRFYCGLAATGVLCWLVITFIPHETIAWVVAALTGLVGFGLSIRWQHRADSGN